MSNATDPLDFTDPDKFGIEFEILPDDLNCHKDPIVMPRIKSIKVKIVSKTSSTYVTVIVVSLVIFSAIVTITFTLMYYRDKSTFCQKIFFLNKSRREDKKTRLDLSTLD